MCRICTLLFYSTFVSFGMRRICTLLFYSSLYSFIFDVGITLVRMNKPPIFWMNSEYTYPNKELIYPSLEPVQNREKKKKRIWKSHNDVTHAGQ